MTYLITAVFTAYLQSLHLRIKLLSYRLFTSNAVIIGIRLLTVLITGLAVTVSGYPVSKLLQDFSCALTIPWWLITLTGCMTIHVINMLSLKKHPEHLQQFPQLKFNRWGIVQQLLNLITWGIYLIAYEWLWRIALLQLMLAGFNSWWLAVTVNSGLNALLHLLKGAEEAVGSLLFGIAACLSTLYSGSLWPAMLMHLFFAISYESLVLYYRAVQSQTITNPTQL